MDDQNISLSLCMIVRNEEKNLARCLDSVMGLVDEIIIVDTGSTDATKAIAGAYTDRIYDLIWQEDFSKARNYAASLARGQWILTMDADEELEGKDKDLLLQLVEKDEAEAYFFPTISFIGDTLGLEKVINMSLRLYKNKREYQYTGRIHEQLAINIIKAKPEAIMASRNVRIYHYGYTLKAFKAKEKNIRNRRILELMQEENKEDPFVLFSLGNESFASNDFSHALEHYYSSLEKIPENSGYEAKLLLRIVLCLIELKDYDGGLALIELGITKFPKQTDFNFLKGIIFKTQQRQDAARKCFQKCLELGEAPIAYRFVEGVGTYKSHYCLGDIFYEERKYDLAYEAYAAAVAYQINYERALERMIASAIKLSDTEQGPAMVEAFLQPLDTIKAYFLSRAYYKLKSYSLALYYIEIANIEAKCFSCLYLKGKIYFYNGCYRQSIKMFQELEDNECVNMDFLQLQLINCLLLEEYEGMDRIFASIKELDEGGLYYSTYSALVELLREGEAKAFPPENSSEAFEYSNILFEALKFLMEIKALDLFKAAIRLLDYIKDPNAALRLGKLYYSFGYPDQAELEINRSIEMFNICDDEGYAILLEIKKEK